MNYFDRAKLLLESEIDAKIDMYLKSINKKAVEDFKDKLAQGYRVGIKFSPLDSYSDIKATFDLFNPFDKQDVKEYRVTNIKSAREARANQIAKETPPPEPNKKDYDNMNDYQEALKLWRNQKAAVSYGIDQRIKSTKKRTGEDTDGRVYDKFGYPRENKTSKVTLSKVKNYIEEAAGVNLVNAYNTKQESSMRRASDELINAVEKILAAVKIFSFNDFKKYPEARENVYKNLFKAYEAAKKTPMDYKVLTDLKRAALAIKRQGTHSDIYLQATDDANVELYGYKKGREDVGATASLAGSAVSDYKKVEKLDMSKPEDVFTLKVIVKEIFKDMGLWKKGGTGGGTILNPEARFFLGGDKKPEDDLDMTSDTSKLHPQSPEERADFSKGMLTAKKMYNWLIKGFKDISDEEIKQDVLNIKKNGIVTLLALKHRATAPSTKMKVVDDVSNELNHIKRDIKTAKEKRVETKKDEASAAPKDGAAVDRFEALRRKREQQG